MNVRDLPRDIFLLHSGAAGRAIGHAFVPVATVTGAMPLAPVCVEWLIYFIHHLSNAISVNHIVDRIARETELVIDALVPEPWRPVSRTPAVRRCSRGGGVSNCELPVRFEVGGVKQ